MLDIVMLGDDEWDTLLLECKALPAVGMNNIDIRRRRDVLESPGHELVAMRKPLHDRVMAGAPEASFKPHGKYVSAATCSNRWKPYTKRAVGNLGGRRTRFSFGFSADQ